MAFDAFAERGGYPLVHERPDQPWEEISAQLNENVIKRVIVHDLRLGDRGRRRDKTLLEEIFRLGCRYAGQSPSLATLAKELQRALNANVGPQKIRKYLEFLDLALLLRLVDPLELRLKRTRGAPKLCLADHGLRASWLQEPIALTPDALARRPEDSDLAGRIAESIVGTFLITSIGGDQIKHFPERSGEPEVDFVMVSGSVRIPIEVKYRRRINSLEDTAGLRSFIEKSTYRAPFGILVTRNDTPTVTDPRIVETSLSSLLMLQ
jgi:predicted AAA+ superfamily ATPase